MKLKWLFPALMLSALTACATQQAEPPRPAFQVTAVQKQSMYKHIGKAFTEVEKLPRSELSVERATEILASKDDAIKALLNAEQWSIYDTSERSAIGKNLYKWARNSPLNSRRAPGGRLNTNSGWGSSGPATPDI